MWLSSGRSSSSGGSSSRSLSADRLPPYYRTASFSPPVPSFAASLGAAGTEPEAMKSSVLSIDLSITCGNLPVLSHEGTLRCEVSILSPDGTLVQKYAETGEVPARPNVAFDDTVSFELLLHMVQRFRIEILWSGEFDDEESMGHCDTTIGQLLRSGGRAVLHLTGCPPRAAQSVAQVDIRVSVPSTVRRGWRLGWSAHTLSRSLDGEAHLLATYLVMSVTLPALDGQLRTIVVHRTETIRNDPTPKWGTFLVPAWLADRPDCVLRFQLYNEKANCSFDRLIGTAETTAAHLARGPGPTNRYVLAEGANRKSGRPLLLELCLLVEDSCPSPVDHFLNGWRMPSSAAVDLSVSNGAPDSPSSLHHLSPHSPSSYEQAFKQWLPAVLDRAVSGRVKSRGFGAQIPSDYSGSQPQSGAFGYTLSQDFPLDAGGASFDGIVDRVESFANAYRRTLMRIRLFAPSDFSSIIHDITTLALATARQKERVHFLLAIFTDGLETDTAIFERVRSAVVRASQAPLSILVVGVGPNQNKFVGLRQLESLPLKTTNGDSYAVRSPLIFVEASRLHLDGTLIAAWLSYNASHYAHTALTTV